MGQTEVVIDADADGVADDERWVEWHDGVFEG